MIMTTTPATQIVASPLQYARANINAINEAAAEAAAEDVHEFCGECETCRNRVYQDDSLDGGVSFQQAAHVHPNQAATAVIGHEREHQGREARFAQEDGREIILNDIAIFTSLCIECGRVFVSGGETRTITRGNTAPESEGGYIMSMLDVFNSREI
jgi:hypothetical protein